MQRQRWLQIEEIFESAVGRDPAERPAYLAVACAGDDELRREVESLLTQQTHDTPLDRPVWELVAGARLGPYELVEPIGRGGMGTVFKALDTRLHRNVAIKVSEARFSGRFANEARAVAALNHPHVCTLHDVGPNYLVMEFVEGETLAERLREGALSLSQTMRYGAEIADAVAAAHAHGIIHRDLKPANIMLTESGVKVLDFGLAKFEAPADLNRTPTASHAIIGTAAYMSPEQADGKPVDARSDIFSLGAVLYEMATGKHPFRRDSELATLAAILHEEPEPVLKSAPGALPELARIIEHCLRKDPARRFQTAANLKLELEELGEESDRESRHRRRQLRWIGGAAGATLLVIVAAWLVRYTSLRSEPTVEALTSYAGGEAGPSLSPDASKVAFSWNGEKQDNVDIYVKQIGGTGTPLRLTADPLADVAPSWSPDDRWIAFIRIPPGKQEILLITPLGGPERRLVEFAAIGPAWLLSLSWTPDAKWIVYSAPDPPDGPLNIWAVSVETGERRRFTSFSTQWASADTRLGEVGAAVSPDGRTLAFARAEQSYVRRLYMLRLTHDFRPNGAPQPITGERYATFWGIAWTADGKDVVYSAGGAQSQNLWRATVGAQRSPKRLPYAYRSAIQPFIARTKPRMVYTWATSNLNLWRLDLRTKERKMLIGSTYEHLVPKFSPDARKIAFQSNRSGNLEVWTCDADGSNCQQLTSFNGPQCGSPRWSPDGRWLAIDSRTEGQSEIYVIAADGGAPRRITEHPATDVIPSWSRDGRWIYFGSDRSGRFEVWKVPREGGPAVQVTRLGGFAPTESADGAHVYYTKGAVRSPLYRMPVDGGDEVTVAPKINDWADYGVTARGIYFSPDSRTIQFLDFAGSRTSTLVVLDKNSVGLTVSPDDSYVVWSQLDGIGRDLMLVENFR